MITCHRYPAELEDLTFVEECVLARRHPIEAILKLRPGNRRRPNNYYALRGHMPGPLLQILPSTDLRFQDIVKVFWIGKCAPSTTDLKSFLEIRKNQVLSAYNGELPENPSSWRNVAQKGLQGTPSYIEGNKVGLEDNRRAVSSPPHPVLWPDAKKFADIHLDRIDLKDAQQAHEFLENFTDFQAYLKHRSGKTRIGPYRPNQKRLGSLAVGSSLTAAAIAAHGFNFESAEDAKIDNLSLILFLQAIVNEADGINCEWDPERLAFRAAFDPASMESKTDGCLRVICGKETFAIVEVKHRVRDRENGPAILMQKSVMQEYGPWDIGD
ncbi:hypothetical protein V8E54_010347 [Elaphomyces granulatus]